MSEYLNKTGSVIVVLTLIVLSMIMSTQFSFGRFFAAVIGGDRSGGATRGLDAFRAWREERRREKQRREVIAKHTKKGAPAIAEASAGKAAAGEAAIARPSPVIGEAPAAKPAKGAADETPAARAKSALLRVFGDHLAALFLAAPLFAPLAEPVEAPARRRRCRNHREKTGRTRTASTG